MPILSINPAGQPRTNETESAQPNPPTISVVIAWVNPLELLMPGLEALHQQKGKRADEIIVATRHGDKEQEQLCKRFPQVTLLSAVPSMPITALRSLAIKHARGQVVAVTEDHCVPDENWLGTIERWMSRADCAIVGGAVENAATKRLRDWAAFLTEYAGAVRSATGEGSSRGLPGNNVAYKRELLDGLCNTLDRGLWESFYHQQLAESGVQLNYDPQMLVYHNRPFNFFYFVNQRFQFSRSFAAMRLQSLTKLGRITYGVGSALLPPMLFWRGLTTLRRKNRLVRKYLICSPLIGTYVTIGALGEMIGYFLGAGKSLEKIE